MFLKLYLPIIAIMLAVFSLNSYADEYYDDEDFDIVSYTTTRKPTTRAEYIDLSSEELSAFYRKRDVQNIEDSLVDILRKRSNNA